jgi:hypothetical protein
MESMNAHETYWYGIGYYEGRSGEQVREHPFSEEAKAAHAYGVKQGEDDARRDALHRQRREAEVPQTQTSEETT